jgi:hypothetical protein
MLEKMRPAALIGGFVPGPGRNPHADRHRLKSRNRITDDTDAVRKGVQAGRQDVSFRRIRAM